MRYKSVNSITIVPIINTVVNSKSFSMKMSLILCFLLFLSFDVSFTRNIPTLLVPSNITYYKTCKHEICTIAGDYPKKEVSIAMQLLQDLGYNIDPFFGDILKVDVTKNEERAIRLCEPSTDDIRFKTTSPLVMKNTKGAWKYVVNVGKFKQNIRVETCRRPDSNPTFPLDQIKCKQTWQKLYLLTFENFKLSYDEFNVPKMCEPYIMET